MRIAYVGLLVLAFSIIASTPRAQNIKAVQYVGPVGSTDMTALRGNDWSALNPVTVNPYRGVFLRLLLELLKAHACGDYQGAMD